MHTIEVILEAPAAIITTADAARRQEENSASLNTNEEDFFSLFGLAPTPEGGAAAPVSPLPPYSSPSDDIQIGDEEEDEDQVNNTSLYAELERLGHALGLADAPHCYNETSYRESEEEKEEIESPEMEEDDIIGYYC